MSKIVLLGFTALTTYTMADDVVVAQDSQMITDSCSKPSCNTPAPPPPEPCKPPPPPPCRPKPPVCKKPCPPTPVCNNTLCSAAPLSENGWYLFADALYWHADVDNSDWSFKNTNTADPVIRGPNHALNFKWNWGFRAGIGANTDYDQWDTNFYYTWFQTKNSNAVGTSGAQSVSDLFGLATPFTQGSINWSIHYSMIDWELGRNFYVSKHLSLRPHIGLKGGWISQKVREKLTKAAGTYSSRSKNNFWGVGASGGFNTAWTFAVVDTHHFDFFGDFGAALMYGHFDVDHVESGLIGAGPSNGFSPSGLDRNLMVPMIQAMFGMSWDTSFNCNRCHFGLRVGYEFQYWWKQNQMLRNESMSSPGLVNYSRSSGDLGLQGLTVDFRFDF